VSRVGGPRHPAHLLRANPENSGSLKNAKTWRHCLTRASTNRATSTHRRSNN